MGISIAEVDIIEGNEEASEQQYYAALQVAINSGSAWSLQGSYGRSMMEAINGGRCMLGKSSAKDYYGNRIPDRLEVEPGSKGSREFVAKYMGDDWANEMEAL